MLNENKSENNSFCTVFFSVNQWGIVYMPKKMMAKILHY